MFSLSPCSRRSLFKKWRDLFSLAILGAGLYPLLTFVGFKVPVKPVKVLVHRLLPEGGFWLDQKFVLFTLGGQQWAVSRKCTHLGCRLNINENEKKLICPCHQSQFDYSGKRLAGPAKQDLPVFPVEKTKDGYVVIM